jgi:hypothetical protein
MLEFIATRNLHQHDTNAAKAMVQALHSVSQLIKEQNTWAVEYLCTLHAPLY